MIGDGGDDDDAMYVATTRRLKGLESWIRIHWSLLRYD